MMQRLSWYRFTKVFTYLLAVVLSLMVVLLFLLSTQIGSRFTVSIANRWVQNWVQFESFEGTLLRDFTLNKVVVTLPEGEVLELNQLRFRWRPWQLLQNQFHIRVIDINGINITLPATENDSAPIEWPILLPNININMRIRFDHLLVENTKLHTGKQTFIIHRLQTRGRYEDHQLRLHDFQLDAPEGRVQLRAKLSPHDRYAISIEGELHTDLPDIGSVATQIELQGSVLDELNFSIEAKGGIAALLVGQAQQLLSGAPKWELDAALYEFNHPSVHDYVSNFTVQFNGSGDLQEAVGHLLITGVSHDYGLVTLQADGAFAENKAELTHFSVNASEIGLDAQVYGNAHITPDELVIAMEGDTQWRDYPQLVMALNYKGSFNQVDDLLLELKTELGAIRISGSAVWHTVPAWDMTLETQALQLDRLMLPDSIQQYLQQSLLNSFLHVKGTWGDNQQFAQLDITEFNTTVDQQAFSFTGHATFDNNQLLLDDLHLLLGEGSLHASGNGTLDDFSLQLNAQHLQFDDFSLARLNADLWIDSSLQKLPLGEVSIVDFAQEHTLAPTSAKLILSQDTVYRAQLNGSGADLDVNTVVTGEWLNGAWQGAVEQLELNYPDLGHWALNESTTFAFGEGSARVSPFCLTANTHHAKFCAGLEWLMVENIFNAELSMTNIALSLFEPWLPSTLTTEGTLDVEAHYNQQGNERTYQGHVYLQETRLELPDQDVNLVLRAGNIIELHGNEDRLDGRVNISTDAVDGGVIGAFAIVSPFIDPIINAEVKLDFASLNIVSLLIPDIQNVKGELNGYFELQGPLMKPAISGQLALTGAGAEVPSAGLTLEQLNFSILSPDQVGQPFTMTGSVRSGAGELEISGRYDLDTHISKIDIAGSNFTAMNSREIQLVVSPQSQIEIGPNLMRVRGNITVPKALITPPDFKTVDLASTDTIILRGEETLWQSSSQSIADIDLQMSLGDNFKVQAYGFDGRLAGRIRIIEKPNQDTTAVGNIKVESGRYELYGQSLNIDRGTLVFTGGAVSNPGLDLRVSRSFDIEKVTVGARVGGSLQQPSLSLFSTPTMQDAEVLSYLVFGRGFGEEAGEDQNMLLKASLALGMQGGNLLGERLSASLGVDDIMLDAGDTLDSASLYIGKQLSARLYVKYGIGLVEPVNTFFIRYRLTDFLSFETQTGTLGSGADLFYSIER